MDFRHYKLRHSYVAHMLDNDADLSFVQELLGHASLNTTRIYTHVNSMTLQLSYQKADPRAQFAGALWAIVPIGKAKAFVFFEKNVRKNKTDINTIGPWIIA
jgi:nanoRNase/pAp phosphatase (c-di-AMP/oligoRNAs hydrolase)